MILNTGSRTDIPAYYSDWFYHRIKAGYVLTRNPYNPTAVSRYLLHPDVVDAIVFCSKNPAPMLDRLSMLNAFEMFWFVTITPYGKDIEPFVPPKEEVMETFIRLSEIAGKDRRSWRYDPVFISDTYPVDFHIRAFEEMAAKLAGHTRQVVVSFIDLYEKTKRNFPGVHAVSPLDQEHLTAAFAGTAARYDLQIHLCCENSFLARPHVDAQGCLSRQVLEDALGTHLDIPKKKAPRATCSCLLGADIGAYNTCGHGCRYCYANYDEQTVRANMAAHDPASPLLIGHLTPEDVVKDADQRRWRDDQMSLF